MREIKEKLLERFNQLIDYLKQKPTKFYIKWFSIFFGGILLIFFSLVGLVYFGVFGKLPSDGDLRGLKQSQSSLIYGADDSLIGKFYIYDRTNIEYEDFPPYLINALIATEDVRFREHNGVDLRSMFRVMIKSIILGDSSSGGGSTISMQLAKNIYGRRSFGIISMPVNKIKEYFIAKKIEKIYDKNEILTLYLNTVPFSDNTYGIEAASQKFFGKSAKKLTIGEAATLIGSLKATSSYNPRTSPHKSIERRNTVLSQMKKYGYLSQEDFLNKINDTLLVSYQHFTENKGIAPYFREMLRKNIPELLKDKKKEDGSQYDIYKDGLRIYTTIDKGMQIYAEESVDKHLSSLQKDFENSFGKNKPWDVDNQWFLKEVKKSEIYKRYEDKGMSEENIWKELKKKRTIEIEGSVGNYSTLDSLSAYIRKLNVGFVVLDSQTGAVKVYVGGVNFEKFKYDHIMQSKRQVGSVFKPFVYASALESGIPLCSYFSPSVVTYSDYDNWTPSNVNRIPEEDEDSKYSMVKALASSVNTIAVKVLFEVGIDKVVDLSRRMGIRNIPREPSIALGTVEMRPIDLAKSYTGFSNKGMISSPYFIEKITNKKGDLIWQRPKERPSRAISDTLAMKMVQMMRVVVNRGTAGRLRSTYGIRGDIIGKTGTTQDNKDGWFAGATNRIVMVSWVGNDNQIGFPSTRVGQGANSALPIAGLFMRKLSSNKKYDQYTKGYFDVAQQIKQEVDECEPVVKESFIDKIFGTEKDTLQGRADSVGVKKKNILNFIFGGGK